MNYKQISKITIYSLIMTVFGIIGMVIFAKDFPNWIKYDSTYLIDPPSFNTFANPLDALMPMDVQAARAWSAASLITCLLMSIFSAVEIKRMERSPYKKYYIASLGIFTWLMLPYTIYLGLKHKLYDEFLNYVSQNRVGKRQMSLSAFKAGFQRYGNRNKLFWNTTLGYLVLVITLIGFIFGFIISSSFYDYEILNKNLPEYKPGFTADIYYNQYSQNYFILDTFPYFTNISNMLCFSFMAVFVPFSRKILFRNNTILIAASSYIFIVFIIFWTYLFPSSLKNYVVSLQWAETTWTHAVAPIAFMTFAITSLLLNKNAPRKFKNVIGVSMILPLSYGVFAYSLPFYSRMSVYGSLTNINPNVNTSIGVEGPGSTGNLAMIGAIFVLGGAFVLVIFGFWSIAYQINKKETKKMGLE